ncbi:MAG: hypothetical protein JO355_14845 [Planctomycetaceae bacterium]|nr:hypothetical protein [Planctomycetaceae bacterium]
MTHTLPRKFVPAGGGGPPRPKGTPPPPAGAGTFREASQSILGPSRRARTRRLVAIASLLMDLVAPAVAPSPARADDDSRFGVKLTVYDRLLLPGEPIALEAKLEHDGIAGLNPDMRGYPLRFTIPTVLDQEVMTAREGVATAREGVAALSVRSSHASEGPARVIVRFPGSRLHRPVEVAGRIFVWPAASPILITDIDHTISDLREFDVLFTENAHIPALPGAVEALAALARRYRILYLTARDHAFYNKTRDWLERRGFPEGPLFMRDYHVWETQGTFKRNFIAKLKERYPNVAVGVGDRPDDAQAYLDNDMKTLIIDPTGEGRFPGQVLVVSSWREVCALLVPEVRDASGPCAPSHRREVATPGSAIGRRPDVPGAR